MTNDKNPEQGAPASAAAAAPRASQPPGAAPKGAPQAPAAAPGGELAAHPDLHHISTQLQSILDRLEAAEKQLRAVGECCDEDEERLPPLAKEVHLEGTLDVPSDWRMAGPGPRGVALHLPLNPANLAALHSIRKALPGGRT